MTCAKIMAAVAEILGFTPQPGSVVNVPAGYVQRYSPRQVSRAKSCAEGNGIRWRIVG